MEPFEEKVGLRKVLVALGFVTRQSGKEIELMNSIVRRQTGKISIPVLVLALMVLVTSVSLSIEQLKFKPGFNLFAPQQDVQVGREAAGEADKKLPFVTEPAVVQYVNELGKRLASLAPNNSPDYAWTFKVVNSSDINAFALPGGFIYVNRGAIESAEGEAQIAGVIAHETGHVVMRHGTHQASEVMLAQMPLSILGGLLGESASLTARLAEMGIGFGVNSLLLKNSRSAEAQADEVGTYILYHADYDPRAMAQFFQIIEKKYPQRTLEFFSDHPNPENRIQKVDEEIPLLGSARQGKTDSPEFESVKKRLLAMPPAPKSKTMPQAASGPPGPPPLPSSSMTRFEGNGVAFNYPDNWEVQKGEESVALVPPGGIITGPQGESNQAYGLAVSRYQPRKQSRKSWGLVDATKELVESMRQSNPKLRSIKQAPLKVKGRRALSTLLENDSPLQGKKERDHLVTMRASDSLLALMFIAPESEFESYKPAFDSILRSLELP